MSIDKQILAAEDHGRRIYPRYIAPENTYCYLKPSNTILGEVRNISIGGLRLAYKCKSLPHKLLKKNVEIDLAFLNAYCDFSIVDLACKVMYTYEASVKNFFFIQSRYAGCGIKFKNPENHPQESLHNFLINCPPCK